MARYIDRAEAIHILLVECLAKYPTSFALGIGAAAKALENMPPADVEEVWHGRWVRQCDGTHYCSVCGLSSTYTLYGAEVLGVACPHCGAKMEEGDEG